jgi:GntR family transcriptional repressor for pyruvate dehydrogenase complex
MLFTWVSVALIHGSFMDPLFREARQSRIFEDVVEQIEEAILGGRLKAGDRLPAERDLKEMLKTSRSTLREALRVLEQKGLIEIRLGTGGGAVVKSISSDQISQSLGLLIRSRQVSLAQLAEFRERFEGDVVELAASRADDTDLAPLYSYLEEAGKYAKSGEDFLEDFLEVDKKIHLFFAQMTQNPIYISILRTVHDNINLYFKRYLIMASREMEENLADLYDVVAAIERRDGETARKLLRAHVHRFNAHMEKHREGAQGIRPGGTDPGRRKKPHRKK